MALSRSDPESRRAPVPEAIAAIDIGTNSVHMVVARVSGAGRFEVLTRQKEMVRLGSGPSDMRRLAPDAIDRGVAALTRCRQLARTYEAPVFAVATSAVREAENREEFIGRARLEADVAVQVISGFEEARLIHLGVLQSLPVFDDRILLCDIGGGSTELLVGQGTQVIAARSLKLGAIRLTQRFFADGEVSAGTVDACRRFVRDSLLPFARAVPDRRFDTMVGSSGTIETVLAMALATSDGTNPRQLNAEVLTRESVRDVVDALEAASATDSVRDIPGIDPSRADILLAGSIILHETMRVLGADRLVFSDAALREGVLLDALQRFTGRDSHQLSELRRHSVLHLMELCEEEPDHSFQVAWIACRLFEDLRPRLGMDPEDEELLEAAALLANVGLFISHAGHHKHSYYVIRNSEHLTGFTDHEIELISLVARYHRKSAPSVERHPEFAAMSPEDQHRIRVMAGILRVAIGLDRSHSELVRSVSVREGADEGPVLITAAPAEPDADLSLELWSANERSGLLRDALGSPVVVEGAGTD